MKIKDIILIAIGFAGAAFMAFPAVMVLILQGLSWPTFVFVAIQGTIASALAWMSWPTKAVPPPRFDA
jgi:hypothetical protein